MRKIVVNVGGVQIGGENPILIQTMCNTATQDVEASFKQCVNLYNNGAQLIRLTTQGAKEVDALKAIKKRLRDAGINVPLVADIHFSPEVAHMAAKVADKVRINPGNFAKDIKVAQIEFSKFLEICKEHNTAVRIGINHGSLGESIISRYGDTPEGMAQAALEWIDMAQNYDFENIVISLKSSNTRVMVDAYRLLWKYMNQRGVIYPLHLGVTEAGNGLSGRLKSAVGTGALLKDGIGDTIRVSLTEDPVNELPVARFIADFFDNTNKLNREKTYEIFSETKEEFMLEGALKVGPLLLDNDIDDFSLLVHSSDLMMDNNLLNEFKEEVLQASRRKFTKPEYIACPGCGRTLFDLQGVFEEVKSRTSHLKGYKIAVMGCIVNGPGEMADADFGYVGEGRDKVSIYRGKQAIYRSVPQEKAIDILIELIEQDIRSKDVTPQL